MVPGGIERWLAPWPSVLMPPTGWHTSSMPTCSQLLVEASVQYLDTTSTTNGKLVNIV